MRNSLFILLLLAFNVNADSLTVTTNAEFRTALANAATNGKDDTITITANLTTEDGGTFIYASEEENELTIKGINSSNKAILDGKGRDQILYVKSPTTVRIRDLVFQNGYSDVGAGALQAEADITINYVLFKDNIGGSGGAINFADPANYDAPTNDDTWWSLWVRGSEFDGNSSSDENEGGGAIQGKFSKFFISGTDDEVNRNEFKNNDSAGQGGAIKIEMLENKKFAMNISYISYSKFDNNKAGDSGGAIAVSFNDGSLEDTYLDIQNSSFTENESEGKFGGCIYSRHRVKIENSTFNGCKGAQYGGAVSSSVIIVKGETEIYSYQDHDENKYYNKEESFSIFSNNTAENGGALHIASNGFIATSKFFNNNATKSGKDLYFDDEDRPEKFVEGQNLTIVNSIFAHDAHDNYQNIVHLDISNFADSIIIANSLFDKATLDIYQFPQTSIKIVNNIFMSDREQYKAPLRDLSEYLDTSPLPIFNNNYINLVLNEYGLEDNIGDDNIFFDDVQSQFADYGNGSVEQNDYRLRPDSDLVDKGSIEHIKDKDDIDVELFITDETDAEEIEGMDDLIHGVELDIGPDEYYGSPMIHSLSYIGELEQGKKITFTVEFTLASDANEASFEWKYDHTYSRDNNSNTSHRFHTEGEHEVKVTVTDSKGRSLTEYIKIYIEPYLFSDLTLEDKLEILEEELSYRELYFNDELIETFKNLEEDAKAEGKEKGFKEGKDYVEANLPEFGLVTLADKNSAMTSATEAGKRYVEANLPEFGLVTLTDKNAAVTSATETGIETGKQYVRANLPEFGLVTLADKNSAVTSATETGIETGKQYVQANLPEFGLVTLTDKNAAASLAMDTGVATGKQYVQANLPEFGLVTLTDKNAAVTSATEAGIETGKQYVQANLPEFGLVTLTDKNAATSLAMDTGVATGKQYVQANLPEFGLVTLADKNTAVTSATEAGIETGKQYVRANLPEFGLVTLTDKNAAVTSATETGIETGKQYVQANLPEFGLVTFADKNAAVTSATETGIETGKQYVQANLPEFGLVTLTDKNAAVSLAMDTGVATGKQYVQANLPEFGLVTLTDKNAAVTSAIEKGIETGKQYVQVNLAEFNLVTKKELVSEVALANQKGIETGIDRVVNSPADFGIDVVAPWTKDFIDQLPNGWKMRAVPSDIDNMSIFDDAKIVWQFDEDDSVWKAYSSIPEILDELSGLNIEVITSIKAGTGIFIEKE